jgi:hypothetical protein
MVPCEKLEKTSEKFLEHMGCNFKLTELPSPGIHWLSTGVQARPRLVNEQRDTAKQVTLQLTMILILPIAIN